MYKALTHLNLPFIEVRKAPGATITKQELKDAKQTDEDIQELLKYGSISEDMEAPLHPSAIIPDPTIPTIASVVADAKRAVRQIEEAGGEVPKQLAAVANLDYNHATSADRGASDDRNG